VLTSVGLDHTDWLGETELEIAAEKLAVLRDASTLVLGRVDPGVEALAWRVAAERGARVLDAPEDPGPEISMRAAGAFQRRNFALAAAAAEAFLGRLEGDAVAAVAGGLVVPGRLEQVATSPPTFVDVAHNPDGAAALAESLPAAVAATAEGAGAATEVVGVLAVLADKDAEGIVAALAPGLDRAVCAELPTGRACWPAAELAAACERAGLAAEAEPDFAAALRRGHELAAGPPRRALLITGSHYVLGPVRQALESG
jgi:dihydrofolate synthase/folylpolyglutamate synthase